MTVAFSPLVAVLALVAMFWPRPSVAASPGSPPVKFPSEKEAEQRCPNDLVVWLDLPSRTYYYRGQKRYGATQSGGYVCRDEAKGARMRSAPGTQ